MSSAPDPVTPSPREAVDDVTPTPDADVAPLPLTPREQRRAQRQESRRREILTVAERLFSAHGYDGTSLEKIAAGSGYSVGGIYNFFPSKDAVYGAVLDHHATELTERLTACLDLDGSGMDKLLAMASTAVRDLRKNPHQARLTLGSVSPEGPAGRAGLRTVLDTYAVAIRAGQRDGSVRAGHPRNLARYVGAFIFAQTQVDPEISGDPEGISLDDFADILRRALGPGTT